MLSKVETLPVSQDFWLRVSTFDFLGQWFFGMMILFFAGGKWFEGALPYELQGVS